MAATATIDVASLPDDPGLLKTRLAEFVQKYEEARRYAQSLEHAITQLRRMHFGPRTERLQNGQQIFAFYGTVEASRPAAAESATEKHKAERKPDRTGARVLSKDLPETVIDIDLAEHEKTCTACGRKKIVIGKEESTQLDYEPGRFSKIVRRRKTYACPEACRGQVKTAPLPEPAGPIERGLPTANLLAHVIQAKYGDHVPYHRQSMIYARSGMRISRSTLCDWIRQAIELLAPIIEQIRRDVLASARITTDDTVVRLMVPGKGRTVQGRIWGYLGDARHNQVFYEFSPDRKQEHPQRVFEGFRGKIHADAYSGYNVLFEDGSRTEIACWCHFRRRVWEARDTDPERASIALGFIRQLYAIEAEGTKLDQGARAALRQAKSVPILKDFKAWLDVEVLKVLLRSPIGEAIRYGLGQWTALGRYIEDGETPMDTNGIERLLRGIALGRKNFMFVASPEGGRWAAGAYTLVESAKLNGIDPYRYLKDVLLRVWTHPAGRIDDLMPRRWAPAG